MSARITPVQYVHELGDRHHAHHANEYRSKRRIQRPISPDGPHFELTTAPHRSGRHGAPVSGELRET